MSKKTKSLNKRVNVSSKFKRTYEVMKAGNGPDKYDVGGTTIDFKGKEITYVDDPKLAKDIELAHGGLKHSEGDDLRVMEVDNWNTDEKLAAPNWKSGGRGVHKYIFSSNMPDDGKTMRQRLKEDPSMEEVRPGVWKKK